MRPGTARLIEETGTPEQKATGMPVCQRCRDSSVKHVATHDMEPTTGIEPALAAWEAAVLPLNYVGTARLCAPAYYTPRPLV